MLQKAMVSSSTPEHETPKWLFDTLNEEFNFTLDPCATRENAKCKKFFTEKENGLLQSWKDEIVFVNPPYCGKTAQWVKKAYEESCNNATVVMLISAATGRNWWQDYVFKYAAQIRWIQGFIKFAGAKYGAPFASAIVIFTNSKKFNDKHIYNYLKGEIKIWQK